MAKKKQTKKKPIQKKAPAAEIAEEPKDFLDMIAPGVVRFNTDYYICGNTYRTVFALRGYPPNTDEVALLRHLGDKTGVTLMGYIRKVPAVEEDKIISNATNKNRMNQGANNMRQSVTAEANLQNVAQMVNNMERTREPLEHCAVFFELSAQDPESLRRLQNELMAELVRSKLSADRVLLRQKEGFKAVNPAGENVFGSQYERVLPASSVANLFPFNYSGKTDPHGFYIGKDRYGSNIIVDLDRRAEDKTNASILILGNSGEGKSFLLKLLLINCLEAGKTVICLDPEHELEDLAANLNGCFIDLMDGKYRINPLEPKLWDVDGEELGDPIEAQRSGFDGERSRSGMSEFSPLGGNEGYGACGDDEAPAAFSKQTRLSQHISFLKDFFRAYKDFSDKHIDVIELMLERLYRECGMTDETDFSVLGSEDYPILSDLYAVIERAYQQYEKEEHPLYPKELLQEVLLGLRSMCVGAESKFFNGHTNITSDRFLVFGVKKLLGGNTRVKDAILFNVLSYLSDKLLTEGNTVATLDELYIWLSSRMTIEYIRNTLKRVRKKESALIMASQNLEDFNVDGIRELTRPLFAIPTHQYIFHCGAVDKEFYMNNLQLAPSEYEHIRYPQNGVCIYKCGAERFLLEVKAPPHKQALYGKAGGR